MKETQTTLTQDTIDVRQLARAIRFALVAIVLGLSYLSLRGSLSIGNFSRIFADMLAGSPLPALTQFVLSAKTGFVAVSILVPVVAISTLLLRSIVGSFYVIGILALVTIAQFITLYYGLMAPLGQIISGMTGNPDMSAMPPPQ